MKQLLNKFLTPHLKRLLRIKAKDFMLMLKGERKIQSKCPVICFAKDDADTFFGYYDITPFNRNDELIYVELSDGESYIKIVHNTLDNTKKHYIARSNAWNWQQGCRLRWFAGLDYIVSFNDFDGHKYFNRILNIATKDEKVVDWPLYDIDAKGQVGLSLNFERLGYLRPGYGYTCRPYNYTEDELQQEGIVIVDIIRNMKIEEILYPIIKKVCGTATDLKDCYINHLSFSPSGMKFLFFWIEIIDGYHKASLVVYDMVKKKLIPLELQMKVSHYVWQDENTIICTVYDNNRNCRYYSYQIETREKKLFCDKSLTCDGHPSFITNPSIMLTDTYPDTDYFQHLYSVNVSSNVKKELVKIYSDPMVTGEKRTDLHPRLNANKRMICFDANVSKNRKLYIIKL